ncbi:MAG: dihydrolipoyl dehydrogenase [Candidatus Lokiarchaeota archaeon]|nr:dihydrolipoyl dehydrogenase [Candidatus Lokiarchaeota archaeon]
MQNNNEIGEKDELYDVAVIGAGPGGYHAAIRAAQYGAKAVIVEKSFLGGTCSNWGCIPTKALYASAVLLEEIQEKAAELGINVAEPTVDFSKAVERKNNVVKELREGIAGLLKSNKVDVRKGFGRIVSGDKNSGFDIQVEDDGNSHTIKAKRVIIATGSKPALIPAFNIDHKKILTSDDILTAEFNTLPKRLLVIGAGVIGCEFGNIFSRLGAKVTMLEYLPTMIATEERLVIKELKSKFDKMGIELHVNQNVLNVEATDTGVKATTCDAKVPRDEVDGAEKQTFEADLCLVSIGRAKEAGGMGLEDIGVEVDRRAGVIVDAETMETKVAGIYAIGDVNNQGLMLAHVASYHGDIAVSNALNDIGGFDIHLRKASKKDVVPYTIFTEPEIGSVGMRSKAAKQMLREKGKKAYIGRFYYNSLGKAKCMGKEDGFLMIVADSETDEILGASCIGAEAPEIISEITLAMQHGITAPQLGHTIHSHPTLSELVLEAAEDVHGLAIHKAGRRR